MTGCEHSFLCRFSLRGGRGTVVARVRLEMLRSRKDLLKVPSACGNVLRQSNTVW